MKFLVEWIDGAPNVSAEERATTCDLRIVVGDTNACLHKDEVAGESYESIVVPAVHLAEGIATDWWNIFGGRDCKRSIWPYGTGFILPCLSFGCHGSTFEVSGEQMHCENPGVRFWRVDAETISRDAAEHELARFVQDVVDRLSAEHVEESEVQLRWKRVSESRLGPEETAFCESAGALGVDPYAIGGGDADFIMQAGKVFSGATLTEFLAGVNSIRLEWRYGALASVADAALQVGPRSTLPELRAAADSADGGLRERRDSEGVWGPAYRLARAFRQTIGVNQEFEFNSVYSIAGMLGNASFEKSEGLSGVEGVVSWGTDVHIHLRRSRYGLPWFENFNMARAIGDAICFPEDGPSVINRLHGAERQAAGRAFAAEFLAPVEAVLGMDQEGYDVGEIAGRFVVDPRVIQHQIENRDRIERACSVQLKSAVVDPACEFQF